MAPGNDPLGLAGTTIGDKYQIEAAVGEGGFAVVYRALHTVWKRPVAIKVFRALGDLPPAHRQTLIESFIQEGRLLNDLSERSSAICQARDVGMLKTGGREMPYMVLEWLEGKSLEQVLDSERAAGRPPRSVVDAVVLLEPAAEALALAHRQGIAHRDVKPANIFILGDPRGDHTTKVLDFGIAKVVQDAQRMAGAFAQTQGVASAFTPAYGAPEQFSRTHGATGPWTDVFAMGLVLAELVTHKPPLVGDDLTQLAFCAMDPHRRPTPRTLGAVVPEAVEAVLRRALAVSPEERFRSMAELWNALRAALGMDRSRAFGTTDPQLATAAPELAAAPPLAAAPLPLPPRAPSMRTAPAVVHTAAPTKSATTFLAVGAGVAFAAVFAVAIAVGAWALSKRAKNAAVAAHSASASAASASARESPPPPPLAKPSCPSGMVAIPGGKFFMGSDDKQDDARERPAHQVILSPYCMDATEVTVAQYKECSDRGECRRAPRENDWEGITPAAKKIYDPLCTMGGSDERRDHPINCIDWELASAFCTARGKRLPTEAEWEFATRGSDGRKYPWGDDPPTRGGHLNACGKECVAWGKAHPDPDNPLVAMYPIDDGFPTTAPVGSFPKGDSPFGVHDVVGNVWEWTADYYAEYGAGAEKDPTGPPSGTLRVIRGGAWNGSDPAWVRPTFRFMAPPRLRSHGVGFRCARTLDEADR